MLHAGKFLIIVPSISCFFFVFNSIFLSCLFSVHSRPGTGDSRNSNNSQNSAQGTKPPKIAAVSTHTPAAAAAAAAAAATAGSALVVGTRIEANYRGLGTWYPGSISHVNADGSGDIDYDDGEKETHVAASLIRPEVSATAVVAAAAPASAAGLPVGTRVEGNYRGSGHWYPGVVSAVHGDGSVDLNYDDGEKETHVAVALVRMVKGAAVVIDAPVVAERRPINPMLASLGANPQVGLKKTVKPMKHTDISHDTHTELVKRAQEQRTVAWKDFCADETILPLLLNFADLLMGPLLGRGKFAAVYSATHVMTGGNNPQRHSVAVKLAQFKGNDVNNWTPLSTPRGTIAPPLKPEEVALAAALNAAQSKDTPVDAQGRPLPPLACTTEFHREIKTLKHFAQHPNIVRLVGFTLAPLAVMLELLPEGSLYANLHDSHWQVSQFVILFFFLIL